MELLYSLLFLCILNLSNKVIAQPDNSTTTTIITTTSTTTSTTVIDCALEVNSRKVGVITSSQQNFTTGPTNVVDGKDTYWIPNIGANTPQWLIIGPVKSKVSMVIIYFKNVYKKKLLLQVSNDTIFSTLGVKTNSQNPYSYVRSLNDGINAKYWKILFTSTANLIVVEVILIGRKC